MASIAPLRNVVVAVCIVNRFEFAKAIQSYSTCHGPACPGHPGPHTPVLVALDGPLKVGHDGEF
jgi:hypothetical protein